MKVLQANEEKKSELSFHPSKLQVKIDWRCVFKVEGQVFNEEGTQTSIHLHFPKQKKMPKIWCSNGN